MAETDTPVPIQQSPTEASSVTLLADDYADTLNASCDTHFASGSGPAC
jgi:hypothetical protein